MRSKLNYTVIILFVSALMFQSCRRTTGSGNIITNNRDVESFNAIDIAGPFEVELQYGAGNELKIEADDNLMKSITTTVSGGVLKVKTSKRNLRNATLRLYITAPVNSIDASTAANIRLVNELRATGTIHIDLSSAASVKGAIDAPEVIMEASSGAEINVSGRTKNIRANSSSGADINAFNLLAETASVSSSSGASVDVHASVTLDASASSGGNIEYRGGANVKRSTSSGGDIVKND